MSCSKSLICMWDSGMTVCNMVWCAVVDIDYSLWMNESTYEIHREKYFLLYIVTL